MSELDLVEMTNRDRAALHHNTQWRVETVGLGGNWKVVRANGNSPLTTDDQLMLVRKYPSILEGRNND